MVNHQAREHARLCVYATDLFAFVLACAFFSSCTRVYNTVTTAQLQRRRKEKFPKRKRGNRERKKEKMSGEEKENNSRYCTTKVLITKEKGKGRKR